MQNQKNIMSTEGLAQNKESAWGDGGKLCRGCCLFVLSNECLVHTQEFLGITPNFSETFPNGA